MKGHIRPRVRRKEPAGKKRSCRRWQLVVDDIKDESGKRKQRYRAFEGSKADAERALRKFIEEVETGFASTAEGTTLANYLERWLGHVSTRLRPRSLASYRQLAELHVIPYLGQQKLSELRPMHVQDLYQKLLARGRRTKNGGELSANSVLHVHRVLFSALKQAVRWRLVPTNVAEAVEPPRIRRTEMRTLDAAEVRRLLGAAEKSRLYEVILIAVTTGMRRGEILGLRWADVDFDRSRITVSSALQLDGSLAEPKTPRSRRDVGMPTTLRDVLRTHKARQNEDKLALGAGYVDQGLVFANESGGSWKADGISTLYRGIVKRAGLGTLRFHDLRHTAASLMLQEGLPITTVAAILGHANTSTTLSVYGHAIKGSEQGAAVLMEGILQGTAQGPLNLGGRPGGESRWPNEGQIDPQSLVISEKAL
jgi:integrase